MPQWFPPLSLTSGVLPLDSEGHPTPDRNTGTSVVDLYSLDRDPEGRRWWTSVSGIWRVDTGGPVDVKGLLIRTSKVGVSRVDRNVHVETFCQE